MDTRTGRSASDDIRDIEQSPYGRPGEMISENTSPTGTLTVTEDELLPSGERVMTLNMGPQHPSTHGVMRVVLKLDGEMIIEADPVIGYLHRGTEKLGEGKRYAQITPWTDRTDYVAAPLNNLGYVLAVEKLVGVEAPERAQYWRVIMAELSRIASHLVWLGTHALDIGALSMSLYCFREREMILDIFESFCGARLTTNMMEIGGFSRPTPGWPGGADPQLHPRLPRTARRSTTRSSPPTRSGWRGPRASASSRRKRPSPTRSPAPACAARA